MCLGALVVARSLRVGKGRWYIGFVSACRNEVSAFLLRFFGILSGEYGES
jgi:hypothetical protein